jgi:predicted AlkP superfamily pyrophosphatase or phosphodiesterase
MKVNLNVLYKLLEMDKILEYLIQRLEQESILDNLNIVIVSDHGMASMLQNGTQLIGNYLDVSWIDSSKTIYGVVSNIYPKNESLVNF